MYCLKNNITLRLIRRYFFAFFTLLSFIMMLGCQGIFYNFSKPLDDPIHIADLAFDGAEAKSIFANHVNSPNRREASYTEKQQLFEGAIALYEDAILQDVKGIHTQRAHHEIATIYKRLYQFDQAIEHYQTILELGGKGYYVDSAKEQIENIRKNQEIIRDQLALYEKSRTIHNQTPSEETINLPAESLYRVAQTYEELEDYPAAIRTYQKFVEVFPKHAKAPQAQFQIGNIYFYDLYDYTIDGGWGAFLAVVNKYPNSSEAKKTTTLLKEATDLLKEIGDLLSRIKSYKYGLYPKIAHTYICGIRDHKITKVEREWYIVQFYFEIADKWTEMRNYPRAIKTYRTIISEIPKLKYIVSLRPKKMALVEAFDRIGNLYQKNGQFERAIYAYNQVYKKAPNRTSLISHSYYQRAICYDTIQRYTDAYKCFKAYLRYPLNDREKLDKARQIVRIYELDQDGDGYSLYEELENGTSDLVVDVLSQEN